MIRIPQLAPLFKHSLKTSAMCKWSRLAYLQTACQLALLSSGASKLMAPPRVWISISTAQSSSAVFQEQVVSITQAQQRLMSLTMFRLAITVSKLTNLKRCWTKSLMRMFATLTRSRFYSSISCPTRLFSQFQSFRWKRAGHHRSRL